MFLFNENPIHIFNAFWSYQPFELPWSFPSGMSTSQPHVFFIFEKSNSWVPSMLPVYAVVCCHLLGYTQPAGGYISKEDWSRPITTVNSLVQGPIKSWRRHCTALVPPMSAVSQNVQKMALYSAPPHPAPYCILSASFGMVPEPR